MSWRDVNGLPRRGVPLSAMRVRRLSFKLGECIDALRRQIAELEFKRTKPGAQARHRREANMSGRYADAAIPRFIAG
jgi:hypothetical protein